MSNYQDVIMESIGEFGRSQVLVIVATKFPQIFVAWCMIMMSFAGADPKWWNAVTFYNATSNTSTTVKMEEKCSEFKNGTIKFEDNMYTIVSEWNLICDRAWITTAITTTQMVGVLVGAAVMGQLADWIGRKKIIIFVYAMGLIVISIEGLSINWQMMIVCAFFLGFSTGGFLVLISVYYLEFIATKWRTIIGVIPTWAVGVTIFGFMFKLFPNWRHLCFATSILGSPFIIVLWFSPPSIRWLLVNRRFEEGKDVLIKLAKRNKRPVPDLSSLEKKITEELNKPTQKYSYMSLFRFASTRWVSLILGFMWFISSFAYYGLTLGVSRLSGDISVNMALMGLGECVCMVLIVLLSKCFGRKYTTLILYSATAGSSFGVTIAYFATETKYELVTNVLALISRFFLSAAWGSLNLATVENFPTVVRGTGYGFVSVLARIGGILAPQNKTLSKISSHLPFTVNGGLTLLAALLRLFLKDTYAEPMGDQISDEVR